jgi:hypothetical protein
LKAGSSARVAAAPSSAAAPLRNDLRLMSITPPPNDFYLSKTCSTLETPARQRYPTKRADLLIHVIEKGGFLPIFVVPGASWVR